MMARVFGGCQNTFSVSWILDSGIQSLKTLKFILQPIIENSFKHGFKYKGGEGKKIDIEMRIDEKDVLITITDNGYGMGVERLKAVQKNLSTDDLPEDKNIGLLNVNRRIKLAFGRAYGIALSSGTGKGTVVSLRVPMITEE